MARAEVPRKAGGGAPAPLPRDAVVADAGEDRREGTGSHGPCDDRGERPAGAAGPPSARGDEDEGEGVRVAERRIDSAKRRPSTSDISSSTRPRSKGSPASTQASASRAEAVARGCIPQSASVSARVSREAEPSSTRRTFCPARRSRPGTPPPFSGRPFRDDEGDPERRSRAPRSRRVDAAAHHLGEPPQMARPRPVPPNRRVVDGVDLAEGSEEPVEPVLRDPDPGVPHDDLDPRARPRLCGGSGPEDDLSRLVNFTAFERRFRRTCLTRVTSPTRIAGTVAVDAVGEVDPLLGGRAGRRGRRESSTASRGRTGGSRARAGPPRSSRSRGRRSGGSGACRRSSRIVSTYSRCSGVSGRVEERGPPCR